MLISIGILAHNESAIISQMLNSLLKQTIFQEPISNTSVEIIIVPNGCSDNTGIVAQKTLERLIDPSCHTNISWYVSELKQPGKSNAWNVYVHELSNPKADYLFLMDSDIELLNSQTLNSTINILDTMPEAWIAVDKPIKNVLLKEDKTWLDLLSVSVSQLSNGDAQEGKAAWICGQLYCGRASVLRQIVLPTSLPIEDSFLYTMIVTDGLKSRKNPNRVILADSASHVFDAYTNINRLLRHERWLIMGSTINELVYDFIKNKQQNAFTLIKHKNEQDPLWLNQLVKIAIAKKGWWLIPKFILIRRFLSLLNKPLGKSIMLFPLALAAFLVDLILSFQANLQLHQGKGLSYWGKQVN